MVNSKPPGGLPMTQRAGGEFPGTLRLSSSDLSEIVSDRQIFWRISRPSGVSQRSVGRYPGPDHTENALITARSALPSGGVDARSIGQRFRALAPLSGLLRQRKRDPGFADSAPSLSHFGLVDPIPLSYRQSIRNRSEAKRRCTGNPSGIFPISWGHFLGVADSTAEIGPLGPLCSLSLVSESLSRKTPVNVNRLPF